MKKTFLVAVFIVAAISTACSSSVLGPSVPLPDKKPPLPTSVSSIGVTTKMAPEITCDGTPNADCPDGTVFVPSGPVYVEPADGEVSCGTPYGFPCPTICVIYSRATHQWGNEYNVSDCAPQ